MGKVSRALISVSHKEGILDFAKGLAQLGIEILSTGGTAKLLRDGGVKVKDVYWCLGKYDIAAMVEADDEQAVTAFGLGVGSKGNVRTETLRAFTVEEMPRILSKIP